MKFSHLDPAIDQRLQRGTVIPAHPLALTKNLKLDEERQRMLTRYYMSAGAGGVAVGVHTTQFEIRKPGIDLLEPVLELAADEIDKAGLSASFIKVAGIVGPTEQALKEARLAVDHGYHLGLVSMGGLSDQTEPQLIARVSAIAEIIPVFGFYLQPAVGGRLLSYEFWKSLAAIPNVQAIKVAAFNRYQTLDVVRAVCHSERRDSMALYTGNDDNIVADLLTPYRFNVNGVEVEKRFVGGLLGHWAFWTKSAVRLFNAIRDHVTSGSGSYQALLAEGAKVTDMNAVVFDAAHSFHGCIPGIHEVLRRQGLLEGIWCLNPDEKLSSGQLEQIERLYMEYPEYTSEK